MKSVPLSQIISVIFTTAILTGFMLQISQVSNHYFSYKTTNRINTRTQYAGRPIVGSICFRYVDIIDRERLGWRKRKPGNSSQIHHESSRLTIRQIFEFTPGTNETLDECDYRNGPISRLQHARNRVCQKVFIIRKFYMSEFMCYSFEQVNTNQLGRDFIAHDLHTTYTVGRVLFNRKLFSDVERIFPMMSWAYLPSRSRYYSETFVLDAKLRYVKIAPSYFWIHLLPPPYDTGCRNAASQTHYDCKRECYLSKFKPHNRVPFSEILERKYDLKHINFYDMTNTTMERVIAASEKECNRKCYFPPCSTVRVLTTTRVPGGVWETRVRIAFLQPRGPDTSTFAVPVMTFIEFFSFIASCFGTWFGISFYSFKCVTRSIGKLVQKNEIAKTQRTRSVHPLFRQAVLRH